VALARDREDSLHHRELGGVPRSYVVVEGPECGQSCVSAADRVVAVALEMVEKSEHDRRVQVGKGKRRQRAWAAILKVPEQKSEGVAVAGDRARTGIPLSCQSLTEEVL